MKSTFLNGKSGIYEDYIVDYKEELDIEQFPDLLVFDDEELKFKGYEVEELYEFFRDLSE